jgi:hypothetical protein
MSGQGHKGWLLRLIASGGWATEDEDVLIDLLGLAERLARAVVADAEAATGMKSLAEDFLERLELDRPR